MTCLARWDFRYGGRLAGDALAPREVLPVLSEGRAWGAAMQALHGAGSSLLGGYDAHTAMRTSLAADAAQMDEAGVPSDLVGTELRLGAMLDHYIATAQPLANLTRIEERVLVPIPSRTGVRASSRYRFEARLDGFTVDDAGGTWLVEFKLRRRLQPAWLVQLSQQLRFYSWALAQQSGRRPLGVIVDERWNVAPAEARILASGRPSHDKSQLTTAPRYVGACVDRDELPHDDVVDALEARPWQQRHRLMLSAEEIDGAGRDLVSAARLIAAVDSGELAPIRNPGPARCNFCQFREICPNPSDVMYVDSLFTRKPPKRLRDKEPDASHVPAAA